MSRWVQMATAALIVLTAAQNGDMSTAVLAVATALLLTAGVAAVAAARIAAFAVPRPAILGVVTAALTIPTAIEFGQVLSVPLVCRALIMGLVVLGAGLVVAAPSRIALLSRRPRTSTTTFVVMMCALMVASVAAVHPNIDVYVFLTEGVRALVHGANPYTVAFPNIYSAQVSAGVYGPGTVVGDHLAYGFPYLPSTLVGTVPGYLLGDVRFSGLGLLGVLAILVVLRTSDLRGRFIAVSLIGMPAVTTVVVGSWTEPLQIALLGFAFVALRRRRLLVAAVLLGVALSTKQYLVVAAPAMWLLRGLFGRREWLALFGSALLVTVPFVLANPTEFWRAVVEWQLVQPFRPDSLSLVALSVNEFGWPPPAIYGLLPLLVGLAVSLFLAWRLEPGPSAFLLTMCLALLATFLLSKQAFVNYYLFVGAGLLLAAWMSSDDDPAFRRRSRSLPSEVAEVGDVRREAGVHP